jgi:DNA end-binding protein Ku
MVALATQLIDEHSSPFKPEVYKNSYEVALLDLIKEKSKGHKIKAPEAETSRPSGRNVVDLMDALKKSVTGRKSTEEPPLKKRRGKKAG